MCVFVLLILSMALSEHGNQAKSRAGIENRFTTRGTTASGFVESYADFLLGREYTVAKQELSTKTVTATQLRDFLTSFGFGPALLLDITGHVLNIAPYQASLIGTELGSKYTHLSTALTGKPTVSNVVASAAQRIPVVAFATPFDTPFGGRVVSGAFNLASQPMGIYMHHVLPYPDGIVYMIDQNDTVVAASTTATGALAKTDSPLAHAIAGQFEGTYRPSTGGSRRFAVSEVRDTPWRIVQTVPTSTLFRSISTSDRVLPWLFLAAFALAGGALILILIRSREGRVRAQSDARTDAMTGIANRRALQEALQRLLGDRRRHSKEQGVLMIDVDRFKAVNDEFGHDGGDVVLHEIVSRINRCLRANDQIGRWGGEEFVVLLPNTGVDGVAVVAERIRTAVAELPIAINRINRIEVTVSIGAAMATTEDDIDSVIMHADDALYAAKHAGRNCCIIAEPVSKFG